MNGILAVDKQRGRSSHDVVAQVRRLTGERRIGHAGTLDPLATGVLVLCLGTATRLSEYLMGRDKWYLARVAFGVATDTDDTDGTILARVDLGERSLPLAPCLTAFIGDISQIPPAFAAIKQNGVTAYERARRGTPLELAPRPVTIYSIALLGEGTGRFTFRGSGEQTQIQLRCCDLLIHCSKGTYIRSIARDMGEVLGCYGTMAGLRRLASGQITVESCLSLDALAGDTVRLQIARALLPIEYATQEFPAAILSAETVTRISKGQRLSIAGKFPDQALGLYDPHGLFCAVAHVTTQPHADEPGTLQPTKVFLGRQ